MMLVLQPQTNHVGQIVQMNRIFLNMFPKRQVDHWGKGPDLNIVCGVPTSLEATAEHQSNKITNNKNQLDRSETAAC